MGVPAHVTVLFPFVAPSRVDDQLVAAVADAVAAVPAFGCSFTRTGWFAQDVLWLDPEPAEPFRRLTVAMWAAFPGHPPYGGAHQDVVPHLTVADRRLADLATMQAAERAIRPALPVTARIEHVLLVAGTEAPGTWRTLHRFPLRPTPRDAGVDSRTGLG